MKKFLAITASAILAVSVFSFAGCGEEKKGTIEGDYKEASSEEIETALESVDEEKAFDNLKGLTLGANLDMKTESNGEQSGLNFNLDYKLGFTDANSLIGSGTLGMKSNGKDAESFNATAYISANYAYASMTGSMVEGGEMKAKVNFEELLGGITDVLPMTSADTATPNIGIAEIMQMIDEYKMKVTMDNSDGLKFKVSVTQETVWTLLDGMPELAIYKSMLKFNNFVFDAYFALDKDGYFNGVALNFDVDAELNVPSVGGQQIPKTTVKVAGYLEAKAYEGEVKVPDGIESDATYTDMTETLKQLIGDIGGLI